jgi:hypothetical protein
VTVNGGTLKSSNTAIWRASEAAPRIENSSPIVHTGIEREDGLSDDRPVLAVSHLKTGRCPS